MLQAAVTPVVRITTKISDRVRTPDKDLEHVITEQGLHVGCTLSPDFRLRLRFQDVVNFIFINK